jgi:hypothetical protein
MDERLKFVAWLLDGEKMAVRCRVNEILRKTGYSIWNRHEDCGQNYNCLPIGCTSPKFRAYGSTIERPPHQVPA